MDNSKHFQCSNVVFCNKPKPLFSINAKLFSFSFSAFEAFFSFFFFAIWIVFSPFMVVCSYKELIKYLNDMWQVEQCSKESLETVTGEETPRPDRTEHEIKALLDDLIERIVNTCKRLSVCAYTTDDSVEDVQRKLRESKVCSWQNRWRFCELKRKLHGNGLGLHSSQTQRACAIWPDLLGNSKSCLRKSKGKVV